MRRWWNRLLVRVGWHKSDWYRATYDASTGWHESYRLRRGGDYNGPWVSTHRWHDDQPTGVMERATFHVWAEEGGWRFGPTPERTVVSASVSGDEGDLDVRVAVDPDDWTEIATVATWPYALTDAEIREADEAMTAAGNVHLELAPAVPGFGPPLVIGQRPGTDEIGARYLPIPDNLWRREGTDQRVLPDDSRGILVTEMIGPESVDGPHVPANMPTDQIPLPQDFNYPAPAIDLDGGFLTEGNEYVATPDVPDAPDLGR